MKHILLTGATSMLGLALIDECISNGTKVIAIIRENSFRTNLIPKSNLVTIIECNLLHLADLHIESNEQIDCFYHFAWEFTDNRSRNNVDAQNRNIGYTIDALKLAHKIGCRKFVGAGSQAEYGRVSGLISPNTKACPDSAYGIAKFAAGRLASILSEELNIEFIWTRIFSTYGVNDMDSTMIMYCIDQLLRSQKPILTKCEQKWDYLNCFDAAKAFYLIGIYGKNKAIYNLGSGESRTLKDFVYEIRDAIDPLRPLGIGEKDYAPKQVMNLCADISELKNDTGFEPSISFKQGIRQTIEWHKKRENL